MRPGSRWWAFGGVLAALSCVALVAGCGGGDGDSDDEDGTPAAVTGTVESPDATQPEGTSDGTPADTPDGAPVATDEPADGASDPGREVDVSMTNEPFAITTSVDSAAAGRIVFTVSNDGTVNHLFRLIRTDLEPDALPQKGGQVDEAQVEVLAASFYEVVPGGSIEVEGEFLAGSYVLICNVPGHYDSGMRTGFTVE